MTMLLEVPDEFSLVALVVVATYIANLYMVSGVVAARKKYGVHYPALYASESENKEAKLFNCVQRGHQNFLETVPFFLTMLVTAGLQHPRIATLTGVFFLAARVLYFREYSSGEPKRRVRSSVAGFACVLVLMGCCVSFTVHQLFVR